MTKINIITREGRRITVEGTEETLLMEAIRDNGVEELQALCGGQLSCATCHVYVDPAFADMLPTMSYDEDDLLDSSDYRKPGSRLSCQITCSSQLDGINIEVAPEN